MLDRLARQAGAAKSAQRKENLVRAAISGSPCLSIDAPSFYLHLVRPEAENNAGVNDAALSPI
jgi:hypothetical protein